MKNFNITWKNWIETVYKELKKNFSLSKNLKRDIILMLGYVIGHTYTQIIIFGETLLSYEQYKILKKILIRYIEGESISYIFGICEFWSLKLRIYPGSFIPRPETEHLVQCALNIFHKKDYIKVLDLGTGIGSIALSLAYEKRDWEITGVDLSIKSIFFARKNASILGIRNVNFLISDWFLSSMILKNNFNLIISNPPYIKKEDYFLNLKKSFEFIHSLVSKKFGLYNLFQIIRNSKNYLISGGWIILEHGWNQGENVRKILKISGFDLIKTLQDFSKNERLTFGRLIK